MLDVARFQVGPLTIPIAADALARWAEVSRPGSRIVYAVGVDALPGHATFVLAREMSRKHEGRTFQARRDDGRFDFIFERSAGAPAADGGALDAIDARVFALLRNWAALGHCCGTNEQIARDCGLLDAAAASYRLRKLIALGRIVVEDRGPRRRRLVTIVATGKRTAEGPL